MIPELGHYGLILAFFLACLQSLLLVCRQSTGLVMAKPLAYGQCVFITIAFASLAYAFVTNDFSVKYVATNSNHLLPKVYQFCAVWGAHEGSMLLWVFVLSGWMAAVAFTSHALSPQALSRILSVLAMIAAGFLSFIILTSNPFERLLPIPPMDGRDLNPILQDPGLVSHPPVLYMGYVGFAVSFAFAIAALLEGELKRDWLDAMQPWTIAAWCFLTLGITMGSWWSYHQLGWGGWWFWDPVENASLLPWLTGTALMHSLLVAKKRDLFKGWTVLLAICAFSLSLMGTFLVRSGVLVSVHAFAVDANRGLFMLGFIAVVVSSALGLYAWRSNTIRQVVAFSLCSRETALLLNNVLLTVSMATVLLGTLYPLVVQALGLSKVSIGAPYFNAVFIPLMIPLLIVMGLGPHTRWQLMPIEKLWQVVRYPALLSLLLGLLLPGWLSGEWHGWVALGAVLIAWLLITSLQGLWKQGRRHWGMWIAHIGLAICAAGIVFSQAYTKQRDVIMAISDTVTLGHYGFHFKTIKPLKGPNYNGLVGEFEVKKSGKLITVLRAEKRIYTVGRILKNQAAIRPGFIHDLYVVLGEPINEAEKQWEVRVYWKPFVRWIWAGGFLMLLGGVLAIFQRRRKQ